MGVVEVVRNLPTILKNQRKCQEDIAAYAPDRLILIDYSGFNLRIAKWARPAGLNISYYISPQVWASRSGRVKQIRANVDRMLVILPFEEAWYAERGVNVSFVGHPLLDVVREAEEKKEEENKVAGSQDTKKVEKQQDYKTTKLQDYKTTKLQDYKTTKLQDYKTTKLQDYKTTIALLPGSRKQEITIGLPLMLAAAARHPEHDYVIAGAPAQDLAFYERIIASCAPPPNLSVVMNDTYGLLQRADTAVVTSGTATLETALFGVPQVVVYKGNWLAYRIAKWMVGNRIKYISLVNLVMDAPVVPELIQADFNPPNLAEHLQKTIAGPVRDQQLRDLQLLREQLGSGGAAMRAARAIVTSS
jgi:lipid-A-disaccharide synthase